MMRPRLLPVTILAMGLLLGQKCVLLAGIAFSALPAQAQAATAAQNQAATAAQNQAATAAQNQAATAAQGEAAAGAQRPPPVLNWDSTQPPPAVCPPESTLNPAEIAVLSSLRKRAAALDAREAALDRKQALVDAAEKSLAAQIAGLQAVKDRLTALAETHSQAEEARWQALVATYEAMDPQAAAGIFDGLAPDVLLPVLTRMNSRKSAVILADMAPDKAREATEMMAGQGANAALPAATGP